MRARIVKIGNSQGIRIPKPLLEQSGISEEVDVQLADNKIGLRPLPKPREGWDLAFREMAERGDDVLISGEEAISHSWDETEWQW